MFGSDLPVENVSGIKFEWRDGPFLKALCNSKWILLDEVLNHNITCSTIYMCVLDELGITVCSGRFKRLFRSQRRGTYTLVIYIILYIYLCLQIYIPELNKLFRVPLGTRLFACQNPLHQGGGRKGLPRSFVNRFTQVSS